MLPYYLLLLLPLLTYGVFAFILKNKPLANKLSLACFFAVLFFLLALRSDTVGIDVRGYEYYFHKIAATEWKALHSIDIEFGYTLFNKIISVFTSSFQIFLAIVALVTVAPIALVYLKDSEKPDISIILFINMSTFVLMFSGLRQAISISIGLIVYYLITHKKGLLPTVASALLILVALSFHISAVVLFLMYPLHYIKISLKWLLFIVAPAYLFVFIFNKSILSFAMTLLPEKYAKYSIESTGAYTMILLFAAFIIICYIIEDPEKTDKITSTLRNFLLFALAVQLFAPVNSVAMRFNYYYIIFIPLLIPKVINSCSEKYKFWARLSHFVIVGFFAFYFFYNAHTGADILRVFPYVPFWK